MEASGDQPLELPKPEDKREGGTSTESQSKEDSTRHVFGEEDPKREGNEYLDAVLPIAQPTSEPSLTCSGLDTGIEIEDFINETVGNKSSVDEVKPLDDSGTLGKVDKVVNTEAGCQEEREGGEDVKNPEEVTLSVEATTTKSVTTTTTATATTVSTSDTTTTEVITTSEVAEVATAVETATPQETETDAPHVIPSPTEQATPPIPVTTTAGENDQTITIDGLGALSNTQEQGSTVPEEKEPEPELERPVAVPKKAPKSCVVNMASDDEQRRKVDSDVVEVKGTKRNNSGTQLDATPTSSGSDVVKASSKRGRRAKRGAAESGKKASEVGGGKEPAKTRSSGKEPKQVQVTFDLTTLPFTDTQQVQLRAQILVYGAILQGSLPDESLMGAAFVDLSNVPESESFESHLSKSRSIWEKKWNAAAERILKASAATPTAANKDNNTSGTPLTSASTPTSDFSAAPPAGSPIMNMASATVSSWNSARSKAPADAQVPESDAQPVASLAPATEDPAFSFETETPESATATDAKGTKRKRKEQEPATPAASAPPEAPEANVSPATAGLLEETAAAVDLDKIDTPEELVQRLETAKLKAEVAATAATNVLRESQHVWNDIREKSRSNNISSKEAQLASSMAALTAAASVAKAAAAAANVAYAAALQARAMAGDIVSSSSRSSVPSENDSDPTVTHVTQGDELKALISGTKDAVKEHTLAANFDMTRAENLNAVVRAAELAAQAASQAGTVLSIGDPSLLAPGEQAKQKLSGKRNTRSKTALGIKKTGTETDPLEKQKGGETPAKAADEVGDAEAEPSEGMVEDKQQNRAEDIVVGSHVEIVPDEDGLQGVWFSAKVVSMNGNQALVVYDELLDDDGNGKLEEWVDVTSRIDNVPRVRIAHPMTNDGGMRKRRRAALGNQLWMKDDHVDVWMRDGWWEGIVQSVDDDENLVTVYFPGDGDTEITKSWNLRPSLVWQDNAWQPWRDTPNKRPRFGDSDLDIVTASGQESPETPRKKPGAKPTKRKKFTDVIEKDQQQQQQKKLLEKGENPAPKTKKVSALSSCSVKKSPPSSGKKKKTNGGSEVSSDVSKDGEVRKSGRMIHPTSKLLEGLETTPKSGNKNKTGAAAAPAT